MSICYQGVIICGGTMMKMGERRAICYISYETTVGVSIVILYTSFSLMLFIADANLWQDI
jgi:hypothetical protein